MRFRFDSSESVWPPGSCRRTSEPEPGALDRHQCIEFLKLVHEGMGRTMACGQLKIDVAALRRTLARRSSFRHALEQVEQIHADNLFSVLYAAALQGDMPAARFLLARHDRALDAPRRAERAVVLTPEWPGGVTMTRVVAYLLPEGRVCRPSHAPCSFSTAARTFRTRSFSKSLGNFAPSPRRTKTRSRLGTTKPSLWLLAQGHDQVGRGARDVRGGPPLAAVVGLDRGPLPGEVVVGRRARSACRPTRPCAAPGSRTGHARAGWCGCRCSPGCTGRSPARRRRSAASGAASSPIGSNSRCFRNG